MLPRDANDPDNLFNVPSPISSWIDEIVGPAKRTAPEHVSPRHEPESKVSRQSVDETVFQRLMSWIERDQYFEMKDFLTSHPDYLALLNQHPSSSSRTLLNEAITHDNQRICRLLLEQGANIMQRGKMLIRFRDEQGVIQSVEADLTAVESAAALGNVSLLKLLLTHDRQAVYQGHRRLALLPFVTSHFHLFQYLVSSIDKQECKSVRTETGGTLLHLVQDNALPGVRKDRNYLVMTSFILQYYGVDPVIRDKTGREPLRIPDIIFPATVFRHPPTPKKLKDFQAIIKRGAFIPVFNALLQQPLLACTPTQHSGYYPVHFAISERLPTIMLVLGMIAPETVNALTRRQCSLADLVRRFIAPDEIFQVAKDLILHTPIERSMINEMMGDCLFSKHLLSIKAYQEKFPLREIVRSRYRNGFDNIANPVPKEIHIITKINANDASASLFTHLKHHPFQACGVDETGKTTLHHAALSLTGVKRQNILLLLEYLGADITQTDHAGVSAEMLMRERDAGYFTIRAASLNINSPLISLSTLYSRLMFPDTVEIPCESDVTQSVLPRPASLAIPGTLFAPPAPALSTQSITLAPPPAPPTHGPDLSEEEAMRIINGFFG